MKRVDWGRQPVLLGVIHLPPLPGSPAYSLARGRIDPGAVRGLSSFAVSEALKYFEEGFDGVIIENFGDKPFRVRINRMAYAALAFVVSRVVDETGEPVGVNVLRNDVESAIEIAALSGATFVRVNALCSAREAPEGRIGPALSEAAEALARTKWDVDILADVDVKHSLPAAPSYTPEWEVRECASRKGSLPLRAVIVTGERTGEAPDRLYVESLAGVARSFGFKVLIGSGVTPGLVGDLAGLVDGFIVGTYVKANGRTEGPVSRRRASEIAAAAGRRRR